MTERKKGRASTGSARTEREASPRIGVRGRLARDERDRRAGGSGPASIARCRWSRRASANCSGRPRGWTFSNGLRQTANLGWSARQAGFNYKTVLRHRMNDAAFAEAYDRALAQGYARLQGQLLETEIDEAAEAPIGIEGDR